jgi:hypothetical protein
VGLLAPGGGLSPDQHINCDRFARGARVDRYVRPLVGHAAARTDGWAGTTSPTSTQKSIWHHRSQPHRSWTTANEPLRPSGSRRRQRAARPAGAPHAHFRGLRRGTRTSLHASTGLIRECRRGPRPEESQGLRCARSRGQNQAASASRAGSSGAIEPRGFSRGNAQRWRPSIRCSPARSPRTFCSCWPARVPRLVEAGLASLAARPSAHYLDGPPRLWQRVATCPRLAWAIGRPCSGLCGEVRGLQHDPAPDEPHRVSEDAALGARSALTSATTTGSTFVRATLSREDPKRLEKISSGHG